MYKNWLDLENDCKNCNKCSLCKTRKNLVFGIGNKESKVLFVGEGPGENEDLIGEPFVGRAGKLLDEMLSEIKLYRNKNIYIISMSK